MSGGLPPFGLTLQAPHWWAGKDIENRKKGTAGQVGDYRGPVAITASKAHTIKVDGKSRSFSFTRHRAPNPRVFIDIFARVADMGIPNSSRWTPPVLSARVIERAGCVVATADIVGILPPGSGRRWHLPGWHGIQLANVRVIEPVPCTGALGFWAMTRCSVCGRYGAKGARHSCKPKVAD